MKHLRWMTALLMAAVMFAAAPVQAFAASSPNYISEIRIGYGEEGKAALKEEGFSIWTNLNANEGGNGSAVYIGYMLTDVKSEAITDIALMNMKGGYSFEAYTEELEALNLKVSQQLANFDATIQEFRANYAAGNPFAAKALEVINAFTDDDTLDENGKPTPVGTILLDENTSEETLHRIFLEGNSEAICAIESALAAACIETGEDNVLTRLEETEYPSKLDASGNAARTNLRTAFAGFHSDALSAKYVYEQAESYEGGRDAFLDRENLTETEKYDYLSEFTRYELLDSIELGDSKMTLLEFALLDEEEENEDGNVLESEYLDMLAQAMTPGQLGIVANVGIMTILTNAMAGDMDEEDEALLDEYTETEDQQTVSVYYGVDRTLFTDTASVAMTSTAIREKAASEANDFGKDTGADKTQAIIFSSAAVAAYALGAALFSIGIKQVLMLSKDGLGDFMAANIAEAAAQGQGFLASMVSVGGLLTVVGVIAILAGVVLTIFAILKWLEKPEVPKTVYTQIPRVLVDKQDNDAGYVTYYAAKLAGAAADETDSTKLYGDLNGLNGVDSWVALYFTKNPNAGTPLTDEILISSTSTLNISRVENYLAVHTFSASVAANLNQYNTKSGAKSIYLFFRKATETGGQAGTVFTTGNVLTGLATFAGGAAIAAAVTYVLMKKKRDTAAEKA